MTEKDWYVGAYRDLGGRLMRGEPLANYYTYWNGWEEGNVSPSAGRTLPTSVVVGAQMLHAVGIGYAMKYRGESDSAVVTFFGDGATSEGDFHEAMNYASVWQTIFAIVEVTGDPANDPARERWRRRFPIRPLLALADLGEAPPVEAVGVFPSSLGRHSYIRLTPEQFELGRAAIAAEAG